MSKYNIYFVFTGLMLIWNLLIFAAPFLAIDGNATASNAIYGAFSPLCHQEPSRSLCMIEGVPGSLSLGDCIVPGPTEAVNRYTYSDARGTSYELAVCARDISIYLAILLGCIAYPFVQRKIDENDTPPLWIFAIALVPIALDGGSQFIGLRESTNTLRIITGAIAGFVVPFYLIPLLYYFTPAMKKAFLGSR